jgi:hypothetical protein
MLVDGDEGLKLILLRIYMESGFENRSLRILEGRIIVKDSTSSTISEILCGKRVI